MLTRVLQALGLSQQTSYANAPLTLDGRRGSCKALCMVRPGV